MAALRDSYACLMRLVQSAMRAAAQLQQGQHPDTLPEVAICIEPTTAAVAG